MLYADCRSVGLCEAAICVKAFVIFSFFFFFFLCGGVYFFYLIIKQL